MSVGTNNFEVRGFPEREPDDRNPLYADRNAAVTA